MNNIKEEIDLLFDKLKDSKIYKDYLKVTKDINGNEEIMALISNIKRLKKIDANNDDELVKKEINKSYKLLESYPIYQSYLIITDELKEELFFIKETFEKYFEDILKL